MDGEGMIQDMNMRICRQKKRPRLFFGGDTLLLGGRPPLKLNDFNP